MLNSTSNTYVMKREIFNFSSKISSRLAKPLRKFSSDMLYGILASESCLLSNIADTLHETIKKKNTIERLAKHLAIADLSSLQCEYLSLIHKMLPSEPVIHIDDSDVTKPDGYKFQDLGLVRDGSASSKSKSIYAKGYHVTEACAMLPNGHPVSIFSEIHSSKEKSFTSINNITFDAIERAKALFSKVTFVMDRGYDDNKIFLKMDDLGQDYVVRLTAKRKLFLHGKWIPATELRNRRKGKIKFKFLYNGKKHEAYLSHVKSQITASKKDIFLVLVYGITESPMMLATNKKIQSKEDVIKVAELYFSRWRIEEYFRCKKQEFRFEDFRVRSLNSIRNLNFFITCSMAFLAHISMKKEDHNLKVFIINKAAPLKEKVQFSYYRLAKGIAGILSYAHEGIRLWYRTKRLKYRQLYLKLVF